jgi:hypothetical protein
LHLSGAFGHTRRMLMFEDEEELEEWLEGLDYEAFWKAI